MSAWETAEEMIGDRLYGMNYQFDDGRVHPVDFYAVDADDEVEHFPIDWGDTHPAIRDALEERAYDDMRDSIAPADIAADLQRDRYADYVGRR